MKKRTENNAKTTVFATASLVTLLSVFKRALGFLYRIVLSRLIGAEGVGLYQVSYSLFSVFLTIGAGGIPVTVSRLICKSKAENDSKGESGATAAGLLLCLLLSLPAVLVLLPFADKFTFLFSDSRAVPVFRILMLGLIFSSVYAVLRGNFWGNKRFLLPSVLEIAEESVMVIAGVLLMQNVSSSLDGASKAAWAVVLSYLFSFTASVLSFFLGGGRLSTPKKALRPLFNATLPITSVRASGSLVNSAVAVLLPAMLVRAGATSSEALKLFGVVSGMAMPVLMIPSTIIGSLSLVLVPELSEDFYRKNKARLYKNLQRGISVSFLVACVLLPFFYALGDQIGAIAFSNRLAGELIEKSCPILVPMSLTMITTGMLNSMGFEKQTFLYYFIGAAAMLLCILLLPAVCGVYAYVIGLGASFVVTAACNLRLLGKKCDGFFKEHGKTLLGTAARAILALLPAALIGKLVTVLFQRIFGELLAAVAAAIVLALVTAALYFLFGIVTGKGLKNRFAGKKRVQKG